MMVSNEAELTELQLTAEDEFVVIACDGLWDVLTSHGAVQFCRKRFTESPDTTLKEVARWLVDYAVNDLKSSDNVSVIVVDLTGKRVSTPDGVTRSTGVLTTPEFSLRNASGTRQQPPGLSKTRQYETVQHDKHGDLENDDNLLEYLLDEKNF